MTPQERKQRIATLLKQLERLQKTRPSSAWYTDVAQEGTKKHYKRESDITTEIIRLRFER